MDYAQKISSITTDPNTLQKENELLDLVIKIELIRAIYMPRFSNFLRNSTIQFARVYIW